jgi:propane 2-monooxygenase small subunit
MTEPEAPAGRAGRERIRADDPERRFDWFEPKRRRATLYEDVTVDTQPSIHRHIDREWPVHFEDGRGLWWPESTRLASTDWYAFRDPGELWERSYYKQGTEHEKLVEGAVGGARRERIFEDFTPEWRDYLRAHVQVPAFVEHGLWLALASAGRDCLSDTVAHCVVLDAAMKQRQAQALVLYGLDLDSYFGHFPVERARESFLGDEEWQPTRRYVERLRSTPDWGERVVAANICFEPLVGVLLRRELLMRAPKWGGDALTSALGHVAQVEWAWIAGWTAELMRFALADEQHGTANREVVAEWMSNWLPEARAAADALEPVFDALPDGTGGFAGARENVAVDQAELFESAELTGLAGAAR